MPSITYNLNIPNPPNSPSSDVPNMQTNTNSINTLVNVDHYTFSSASPSAGTHKKVSLANISNPGVPVGSNGVFFSKLATSSWPFWQNANSVYQMMGANANADAATASFSGFGAFGTVTANYAQSAGWTFLPGGMLLQYGSVTSTLGTPQISPSTIAVTFPVVYSTANIVVSITPICKAAGTSDIHVASLKSGTVATSGFTCNYDSSTTAYVGFTWTAIGK